MTVVDDDEVVLEDSEFDKYLKEIHRDDYECVKVKRPKVFTVPSQIETVGRKRGQCKVSSSIHKFIYGILHSQLLLEEDAALLYAISCELQLQNDIWWKSSFLVCFILVFFGATVIGIVYEIYLSYLLLTPLLVTLCFHVRPYLKELKAAKNLNDSLDTCHSLNQSLRKCHLLLKHLNNAATTDLLQTKETYNSFCCDPNYFLFEALGESLTVLIRCCQSSTLSILKLDVLEKKFYKNALALLDEDVISIPNCRDEGLTHKFTYGSLESLKSLHILLQSESLKFFGLAFCPSAWGSPSSYDPTLIYPIVQNFSNKCMPIMESIISHYDRYLCLDHLQVNADKAKLKYFDEFVHLNRIACDLRSVVRVVHNLELLLESNLDKTEPNVILDFVDYAESSYNSFEALSKSMSDFMLYCSKLKKCRSNNTSYNFGQMKNLNLPELGSDENNEIKEAPSAYSPVDQVFFGIAEQPDAISTLEEYFCSVPKMPNGVLDELKSALIHKREEFEEREKKVVENNPEYMHFSSIQDEFNDILPRKNKYSQLTRDSAPMFDFTFQKSLAHNAISASILLNKTSDEDIFGDSDLEGKED